MFAVVLDQVCNRYFGPLFLTEYLKICQVPGLLLGNTEFELPSKIFYCRSGNWRGHSRTLIIFLWSHSLVILAVLQVLPEEPAMTHLQCSDWRKKDVAQNQAKHGPVILTSSSHRPALLVLGWFFIFLIISDASQVKIFMESQGRRKAIFNLFHLLKNAPTADLFSSSCLPIVPEPFPALWRSTFCLWCLQTDFGLCCGRGGVWMTVRWTGVFNELKVVLLT